MQDKLFNLLVKENEITWKSIIFDLIKTNQMDPWDVNITLLTAQYIETLRELKEMDFKISGKVVLAAALLLKIKSQRLVGAELDEFDRLLAQTDPAKEEFYDELEGEMRNTNQMSDQEKMELIPRTPQPRKRKVSIYDLVGALEKALEVKKRRLIKSMPDLRIEAPKKAKDITLSIKQIYNKILDIHLGQKVTKMKFSQLIDQDADKDIRVHTFVPLLHLHNQRKVDLDQEEHLHDIDISLLGNKEGLKEVDEEGNEVKSNKEEQEKENKDTGENIKKKAEENA